MSGTSATFIFPHFFTMKQKAQNRRIFLFYFSQIFCFCLSLKMIEEAWKCKLRFKKKRKYLLSVRFTILIVVHLMVEANVRSLNKLW